MEQLKKWLNLSVGGDFFKGNLKIWHITTAVILIILFALIMIILRKRKKGSVIKQNFPSGEKIENTEKIITLQPMQTRGHTTSELMRKKITLPYEISNIQGAGSRDSQQDSFGISQLAEEIINQKGLLAVLCDGMGGLRDGSEISQLIVSEMMNYFSSGGEENWRETIISLNRRVRNMYNGKGGSTLIAVHLKEDIMRFWSVGDSDIFLFRDHHLYTVNTRHEYGNDLLLSALRGNITVSDALTDPQKDALSFYIGAENIKTDSFSDIKKFRLRDGDKILLCSDGVSDTLSLDAIAECLKLSPQLCCEKIEQYISEAMASNQDNYTAIVIQYISNGKAANI